MHQISRSTLTRWKLQWYNIKERQGVVKRQRLSCVNRKNLVVIGDVKRGDIGSTSEAYAVGQLGKVKIGSKSFCGFAEDLTTVNSYLGSDGIKPFTKVCLEESKGIFVLVKTSNPSNGEFQDRLIDGRPLYEWMGEKVAQWGAECFQSSSD